MLPETRTKHEVSGNTIEKTVETVSVLRRGWLFAGRLRQCDFGGAIMVVEGLSVVDGNSDVHHKGKAARFAMSVHKGVRGGRQRFSLTTR